MNRFLSKVRQFHSDERGGSESLQVVSMLAVAAFIIVGLMKISGSFGDAGGGNATGILGWVWGGIKSVFNVGNSFFTGNNVTLSLPGVGTPTVP